MWHGQSQFTFQSPWECGAHQSQPCQLLTPDGNCPTPQMLPRGAELAEASWTQFPWGLSPTPVHTHTQGGISAPQPWALSFLLVL